MNKKQSSIRNKLKLDLVNLLNTHPGAHEKWFNDADAELILRLIDKSNKKLENSLNDKLGLYTQKEKMNDK